MSNYISSISVLPHFVILKRQAGEEEFAIERVINYQNSQGKDQAKQDGLDHISALVKSESNVDFVLAHFDHGAYQPISQSGVLKAA